MEILKTLGPLDYCLIAVVGLSMLLGAMRGFIHVAMSLAGWFVALIAANFLANAVSPYLVSTGLGDAPRYALAFIVVFVVALVAWSILTVMLKQAVSGMGLASLDFLLGGGLGFIRGAVIVISGVVIVSLTPVNESSTWQNSIAVKLAKASASASKPFLPAKIASLIP